VNRHPQSENKWFLTFPEDGGGSGGDGIIVDMGEVIYSYRFFDAHRDDKKGGKENINCAFLSFPFPFPS